MADSTSIEQPFPIFFDKVGKPLDSGYVYIGEYGKNPQTNPIQTFWDEALTQPAVQPIRTINGYYSRHGTPSRVFIQGLSCSITVRDKYQTVVYSDLRTSGKVAGLINASVILDDSGQNQQQINDKSITTVETVADLIAIQNPKDGQVVYVKGYYTPTNLALAKPYKGGRTVIYDSSKSLINDWAVCINGWIFQGSKLDPYLCGAKGDDVSDDTIAMQRWLDLTESYEFGEAVLPEGRFLYTTALNVGRTTSIIGVGQRSILRPTACHGLNLLQSDAVGARYIKNFWIFGNDGFNHYGINCDLISPAQRVTGIQFDNIYVSWMLGIANLRGVWHSAFTKVYGINNYRGIRFYGKNVKVDVATCYIIRGDALNTGDGGNQYGVSFEYDELNIRSEDVKVSRSIIFGYTRGVNVFAILNGGIENCDIDYAKEFGIHVLLADGGFSIKDNWIALDENSTSLIYGIYFAALGSAKSTNRAIKDNYIVHYGSAPFGSSAGVYIGYNQNMVSVHGNSVESFSMGVYVDSADYTNIHGNSLDTKSNSVLLVDAKGTSIGENYGNKPLYCYPFNVKNTKFGQNNGAMNTGSNGVGIIPAGQTSVTISFDYPIYVGDPSYLLPIAKIFGANNITYDFNYSGGNATGVVFRIPAVAESITQFAYEISVYNRIS